MSRARDLADFVNGIDASKITSGTFADARIAASNVSQHAQSFDDNKIVNDISTLGLRVHTQENLTASNTNSASFDTFQDSSAISNLTNCSRDTGEFMASVVPAFGQNSNTKILCHMDDTNLTSEVQVTTAKSGDIQRSSAQSKFGGYSCLSDGNGDILTFSNMPSLGSSLWGLDFGGILLVD